MPIRNVYCILSADCTKEMNSSVHSVRIPCPSVHPLNKSKAKKKGAISVFKYALRKILAMIPKILAITVILFVLLELTPGDPLTRVVDPTTYSQLTDNQKQEYYKKFGLDRPAYVRYFDWLWGFIQGDFGYSTMSGLPVRQLIADRLPYSIELNFYSLIFAAVIGIMFGFLCAVFQRTPIDYLLSGISAFGISLPQYFFALAFMMIFGVYLSWFPVGNRMPTEGEVTFWTRLPYMVLPIATLTWNLVCGVVRYTRTTMVEVMNKDYIKTARAKGISETAVNVKHCLRNAMSPIMTFLIMRLPQLVGGSVVIEQTFNYLGIGNLSMTASEASDAPLCLFCICVTAIMTLVASTLVDIVAAMMDPRVRFE